MSSDEENVAPRRSKNRSYKSSAQRRNRSPPIVDRRQAVKAVTPRPRASPSRTPDYRRSSSGRTPTTRPKTPKYDIASTPRGSIRAGSPSPMAAITPRSRLVQRFSANPAKDVTAQLEQDRDTAKAFLAPEEHQWLQYVRAMQMMPLPGLGMRAQQRNGRLVYYYLNIEQVVGLRLPPRVEHIDADLVRFQVSVSLFDCTTRQFFGRTWKSHRLASVLRPNASKKKKRVTAKSAGLKLGRVAFAYCSRVHDEQCLGVLELTCLVMGRGGHVVLEKHAIGWTTLNLFGHDPNTLSDISSEEVPVADPLNESLRNRTLRLTARQSLNNNRSQSHGRDFFMGSPLALLFLPKDSQQWGSKIKLSGSKLQYRVYTYTALEKYAHLFRENELLGCYDEVGGLLSRADARNKKGSANTGPRSLPYNPRDLSLYELPRITIRISHPTILLPPAYEQAMLASMEQLRCNPHTHKAHTQSTHITQRTHNICTPSLFPGISGTARRARWLSTAPSPPATYASGCTMGAPTCGLP